MNHNGLLTCSHYAFPPNSLHYCGPEKQIDLIGYQHEQIADQGLSEIIQHFETLYPYLTLIAYENNIKDPFDPRVVEAYWIGNSLLNNVSMDHFYRHLHDVLGLKKKIKPKDLELLYGKLPTGLLPHHTFHVLNVFTRTGHRNVEHTLETMDACRISWGKIVSGNNRHPELVSESIFVETKPLVLEKGKLLLGKPIIKMIQAPPFFKPTTYNLPARNASHSDAGGQLTTFVSFHWNTFCDVLTRQQVFQLERYTNLAISLANKTI